MRLEADRIAELIVVTLGLVLLFVIFPIAIEDIDDGSIRPDVLPNTLASFLVFCGILLATKPGKQIQRSSRELKMVLFTSLLSRWDCSPFSILALSWLPHSSPLQS